MEWVRLVSTSKDDVVFSESWNVLVASLGDEFAWTTSGSTDADEDYEEPEAIDTGDADLIISCIFENLPGQHAEVADRLALLARNDPNFASLANAAKNRLK